MPPSSPLPLRYITSLVAQQIDDILMSPFRGGFTLDQLVELAGQACAQALARTFPLSRGKEDGGKTFRKVLVAAGPGNQGLDGLVAARHLAHFGYQTVVYLPKPGSKPLSAALLKQVQNLDLPVVSSLEDFEKELERADCVLDALFGFNFRPPLREPFTAVLPLLSRTKVPILSVDIPSGWDVSLGPLPSSVTSFPALRPYALISLTAPKEGARFFGGGKHWLGGRFIPPAMDTQFELNLPAYPAIDGIVEIEALGEKQPKEDLI
ncbi:YjeF N-terminal domain-containing protein [Mrakia frigida]|uniref:NADHX epimerase n=1 Tax=Mrakia frigida TaxID=29902 RepID=UPI003FCBFFA0